MTKEQKAQLGQVVWIDPERMSGAPCFARTRVPVQLLLDHLKHGETIDDFLEGRAVTEEVLTTIRRFHGATRHKRSLPVEVPHDGRTL